MSDPHHSKLLHPEQLWNDYCLHTGLRASLDALVPPVPHPVLPCLTLSQLIARPTSVTPWTNPKLALRFKIFTPIIDTHLIARHLYTLPPSHRTFIDAALHAMSPTSTFLSTTMVPLSSLPSNVELYPHLSPTSCHRSPLRPVTHSFTLTAHLIPYLNQLNPASLADLQHHQTHLTLRISLL